MAGDSSRRRHGWRLSRDRFTIPDSNAAVKSAGLVRVNWVTTFDPLQVSDRFITADIPVDVTDAPVGRRVDVIAIPSRFNLDFRTPTGVGYVRAFIEGDFGGSGNTLRLRHAYGQWRRLIFGQTWSTFSDPEAEPDTIDFEGLNAMVHFRQPQVRWTWAATERLRVALAFEDPDVELTGATAANQQPDFVSRLRWEFQRGGHLQAGVLFREIRGFLSTAPANIVGAPGWGVNASGQLPSPFGSQNDRVLFQVTRGDGIGHYITDLNSAGGQDGVYDTTTNTIRRAACGCRIRQLRTLLERSDPLRVHGRRGQGQNARHPAGQRAAADEPLFRATSSGHPLRASNWWRNSCTAFASTRTHTVCVPDSSKSAARLGSNRQHRSESPTQAGVEEQIQAHEAARGRPVRT